MRLKLTLRVTGHKVDGGRVSPRASCGVEETMSRREDVMRANKSSGTVGSASCSGDDIDPPHRGERPLGGFKPYALVECSGGELDKGSNSKNRQLPSVRGQVWSRLHHEAGLFFHERAVRRFAG